MKLPQQRIQHVPQEAADILLRARLPTEVGQRRVNPKQIRLLLLQQWPQHALNKPKPGPLVLAHHQDHFASTRPVPIAQPQAANNAIPHFRQVAVVILRLHKQRLQRPCRRDGQRVQRRGGRGCQGLQGHL